MIGSNSEAVTLKRRRARKMRKLGNWLLGTISALAAIGILGTLIVLPIKGCVDDNEAKKQAETEILYKMYHRQR